MNNKLISLALLGLTAHVETVSATFEPGDCKDNATAVALAAQKKAADDKVQLDKDKVAADKVVSALKLIAKANNVRAVLQTADAKAILAEHAKANAAVKLNAEATAKAQKSFDDQAAGLAKIKKASEDADGEWTKANDAKKIVDTELAEQTANIAAHEVVEAKLKTAWEALNKTQLEKTALYNTAFKAESDEFTLINGCTDADILARSSPVKYGKCITKTDVALGYVKKIEAAQVVEDAKKKLVTDYKYTAGAGELNGAAKTLADYLTLYKTNGVAYYKQEQAYDVARAACNHTGDTSTYECVTGDSIYARTQARSSSVTDKWTKAINSTTGGSIEVYALLAADYSKVAAVWTYAKDANDDLKALKLAAETKLGNVNLSEKLYLATKTAWTNMDTAMTNEKQPKADYDKLKEQVTKAKAELTPISERLKPFADAEFAKRVLKTVANDAYTAASALSAKATADKALSVAAAVPLVAWQGAAAVGGDRAAVFVTFYKDIETATQGEVTVATKAAGAVDAKIAANKQAADQAGKDLAAAQGACKRRMYAEAMAALKAVNAAKTAAVESNKALKEAYVKKMTTHKPCWKKEDGTRAALCDGASECCGQGNRYDRDGTRRTMEVCGTKTQTVLEYYPVMSDTADVEPDVEMWRFYCLGAKTLGATTAAVASALYMAY